MIIDIIIVMSIALAAAFVVAWVLRPALRSRIEAPKHTFQAELRAYNRGVCETREDRERQDRCVR